MTVASLSSKNNSIGFLRFVLACLVVLSHCYPLGGFKFEPLVAWSNGHQTFGGFAVAGFFFLSGYLITQSYTTSRSFGRFLWRRVLRIFPGFWGCLLVTACVFGPIVCVIQHTSVLAYFTVGSNGPLTYMTTNYLLDIKQWGIAGLLSHNPYPIAFDGSLWTLNNEFTCYLAVIVAGSLGVLGRKKPLIFVLLGILLAMYAVSHQTDKLLLLHVARVLIFERRTLLEQAVYFTIGAVFFLYGRRIPLHPALFVLATLLVAVTIRYDIGRLIVPLALPYALIWLACKLPLSAFDRRGDYSYGVYIYAFPVQQVLALLGMNHYGLPIYLLLVMALTLPLAVLSWHCVEKPCIGLKNLTLFDVTRRVQRIPASVGRLAFRG